MVQSAGDLLQNLPKNVSKEFSVDHALEKRVNTYQKSDTQSQISQDAEK